MTPYAVLKVKQTDTDEVIRKTYHAIARTAHPDVDGLKPSDLWFAATEAYTAIKTTGARISWEAKLRIQARTCTKCRGYGITGSRIGGIGIRVCAACKGDGRL